MTTDKTAPEPTPEPSDPAAADDPSVGAGPGVAPNLQDVAAQVRGLHQTLVGIDHFVEWAVPILEHAEKAQSDDESKKKKKPEPPKPVFAHAAAWVEGWFLPTFSRQAGTGSLRWCQLWWAHAEALVRFDALWRSWELLRLDAGTGMGVWFRDHCDSQLPVLLGSDGPFGQCTPDKHEPLPKLISVPVPAALLDALTAPTGDGPEGDKGAGSAEKP